ncbi:MAG: DUF6268 family outer membrane beta-barrel protein [Planctomycetaceae bacterium]|jgi:hypothetical protein|nr:DUF6268 family outer membrane beta-barrel protein [Planctomycetaceae bacterium]
MKNWRRNKNAAKFSVCDVIKNLPIFVTIAALTALVALNSIVINGVTSVCWAKTDSDSYVEIDFAENNNSTKFVSHENSGLINAATIAVIPDNPHRNSSLGTRPRNSIVLPQPYWSGLENSSSRSALPISQPVYVVPATTNELRFSTPIVASAYSSPILLASGTTGDEMSNADAIVLTDASQFGSIPSGTPVFLAQSNSPPGISPDYSPINALSPQTAPLLPGNSFDGPYNTPNGYGYIAPQSPTQTQSSLAERYDQMMSFMNNVMVGYLWTPNSGSRPLGNNELKGQARFAIPCQHLGNTMIFVAPAIHVNFWQFDQQKAQTLYKMPETTFGTFLDAWIEPEINDRFRFDVLGRVGVYSDFKKFSGKSVYVSGRGRIYYQYENNIELMLGVQYINREHIKLLPTFGVIWTPNEKTEWHLIFPDPRLYRYLGNTNDTAWWGYVRGEYGGGSWSVKTFNGDVIRTDYNDIRVALGLEFRNKPKQCLSGHFEIGGAFNRELYTGGSAWYRPSSSVFLAGGLIY